MRTPFPITLSFTISCPPSIRATMPKKIGKIPTAPNEELQELAEVEMIERSGPMTDAALARSRERRIQVARLLYEGAARTSDDYVHAASVLQYGDTLAELERASALANRALSFRKVHRHARWLAAATDDQVKMFRGEPQRFGTQYWLQGEKWELYQVDSRVTDDERAQWDVPPLATAVAWVDHVNAQEAASAGE